MISEGSNASNRVSRSSIVVKLSWSRGRRGGGKRDEVILEEGEEGGGRRDGGRRDGGRREEG